MKINTNYLAIGVLLSISFILLFGSVTALIPNPFFYRMVKQTALDYFFWIASSILLGSYISVHFYKKHISKKCDTAAYSGGIGSFFAFSCPICNKLLVLLFGTTTLINYFQPYLPYLGFLSITLLSGALYYKLKG